MKISIVTPTFNYGRFLKRAMESVLSQNEGFSVRCTVPATGVWNLGVRIKWAEVAAF